MFVLLALAGCRHVLDSSRSSELFSEPGSDSKPRISYSVVYDLNASFASIKDGRLCKPTTKRFEMFVVQSSRGMTLAVPSRRVCSASFTEPALSPNPLHLGDLGFTRIGEKRVCKQTKHQCVSTAELWALIFQTASQNLWF